MIRRESKRWIRLLLVLLALPGLLVLLRDLSRPSPDAVMVRVFRHETVVERASVRFRVDADLISSVIAAESKGDPSARSRVGAIGLMQVMPATARETALAIGLGSVGEAELREPGTNVMIGTAYLAAQLRSFENDLILALAAYNAGPGNVRRWLRTDPEASSIELIERQGFAETRAYVKKVLNYLKHLKAKQQPSTRESS